MNDKEEGILLGELKAFRDQTQVELQFIKKELMKNSEFKWKLAGIVAAITAAFQITLSYFKLKE